MAWQDRPYYRDRSSQAWNPFVWIFTGSIPLFTVFGIRVRAHASLVLTVVLVLIFGLGQGFTVQDRVQSVTMLFAIILLHEFGHCFAARWVGGSAEDILMTPLGGLAFAAPRRWLPTFITVAAGPAVNVVICLITGGILWLISGWLPKNPFIFSPPNRFNYGFLDLWRYCFWIYQISFSLLIFNLLPIWPLDGGQMVQALLWPRLGYYRSMLIALTVGMVGAVLGGMVALATRQIFLAVLAASGFATCFINRRMLVAMGPEEYADDNIDYSAAYEQPTMPKRRRRHVSRRAIKRARKLAQQASLEQQHIDAILAKVSATGMQSLTWRERRALHKATERQRKRDLSTLS